MVNIIQLLPMKLFFVLIFALLPVAITLYKCGASDITVREWASFALIIGGAILVYVVSSQMTSVEMQTFLWPLLVIVAIGLLVYRKSLVERGEFSDASVERGGTDYDG